MYQWDELRIVLAISRHGTLAAAGRALRINSTTVGRRLEAFERRLGARLFTRTRDGLRPTGAGAAAIDTASRIEDDVVAFERQTRDHDARLEGLVRITAGDGIMLSVASLVAAFRARFPGVQLELMAENRVIDLARGEADIAIRIVKPTVSTLVARKVATIGIGMYAREDYLARGPRLDTLHDLAAHTLIGMAPPFDSGPEAQWLARHGITRYDLRCNTISLALALAASGAGIAVLPHNLAATEPRLRRVVRDARFAARDVWLVAHREVRNRAPVRATLGFLVEDFQRNAAVFAGD
ncbi:MAG TPA: LysR family transcriptional regulator [Kofleriaceae bacterium]|jgi:DNA-binding transcriptional LysR family regulator|nr:LysR family transcriptional regulator [Kofleriaceae bacterium]